MERLNSGFWKLTDEEMNTLSIYLSEASNSYIHRGRRALGSDADNYQRRIFNTLDHVGFYDDVK